MSNTSIYNSLKTISKTSLLCLGLGTVLFACKKDDPVVTKSSTTVNFGDASVGGQTVNTLSAPITLNNGPNGGWLEDSVDMDNDGVYDLMFINYGKNWANHQFSKVEVLNNDYTIAATPVLDTLYFTHDNQNSQIAETDVSWNTQSNYDAMSSNDSLGQTINENYINYYTQGSEIDGSAGTIQWTNEGIFGEYANGTPMNSSFFLHLRKGYWADMGTQYLLVRKNTNGSYSYGWVKLEMEDYINLSVFETAL